MACFRKFSVPAIRGVGRLALLMLIAVCSDPTGPHDRTTIIDFDDLPPPAPPSDGTVPRGCSYSEDGFTLHNLSPSCTGGGEFKSIHSPPNPAVPSYINRFSSSVSLFNNAQLGVTRLTRANGGSFALVSIDLDALNPVSSAGPFNVSLHQTITFVGTLQDLTTVSQSFTTDTVFPERQTFTFEPAFDGVIRVEWVQAGPAYHQFDTIVVAARR